MCKDYRPENIFNMDETGYFFRSLPDKTLSLKGADCKGGKFAKDRVTIVLTCSMSGEKLTPWIIGKSKSPRCFRGVDVERIPYKYKSSKKAWMTTFLFNEYLMEVDEMRRRQNRNILLFVDNAPVHIPDKETEEKLQNPLDAGVIRSLKARARKFSFLKLLDIMDDVSQNSLSATELSKKFTVLDAIKFVAQSWDGVEPGTIIKCFKNCGFPSAENLQEANDDTPNVEDELRQLLNELHIESVLHVQERIECFEANVNREEDILDFVIDDFREENIPGEVDIEDPSDDSEKAPSDFPVDAISTSVALRHLSELKHYFTKKSMILEEG